MLMDTPREFEPTKAQQQLLRTTVVDDQHPGPLLHDFEILLDFVEETRPQLTGTLLLPLRVLEGLNAQLARPLQHRLSRPQQKSFTHINGLYWLMRASGLTVVDSTGKKPHLEVDAEARQAWAKLNPTERYCTLLETWVVRAQSEIIGERDAFGANRVVEYWDTLFRRIPADGLAVAGNADVEQSLSYFPGYHNLALLELFGLVEAPPAPPREGRGWQIARLYRTPLGDALLILLRTALYGKPEDAQSGLLFQFHRMSQAPIGLLQPFLKPYFPAWQNNLTLSGEEFQDGLYIFKVALDKNLWRRIAIPANDMLEDLSDAILAAYEFDHDHLYRFIYPNRFGGHDEVNHPYMEEEPPFTTEVRIGDLPLRPGETMIYHFDFGDDWKFAVTLERIDPPDRRQQQAKLLEKQGDAPEQYPSWESYEVWDDAENEG
ncbi:MAG: plasmid pRiA4b ORF-3 family protein [Caldilineaceae bacterium]